MADTPESPWRRLFEEVRHVIGNRRDEHGVLGSINWLRREMEARGANPNVVRNIIYRDKGKLPDKRALFEILTQLHTQHGGQVPRVPELEALLAEGSGAEQEIAQLLGREKRRAYSSFVSAIRSDNDPKLLVTGKPGSGKTLLLDYIQQALELPPKAVERIARAEFSSDLAVSLTLLAQALGVPRDIVEAKLVKLGGSSAYAVQADAQADLARVIVGAVRTGEGRSALILHISQALGEQRLLSSTPLRLNTPDVPRVSAAEWLWHSLLEPLSHVPRLSLLLSMAQLPARAANLGGFEGPIKLNPPTIAEARRFVKARLPQLTQQQQEGVVQRAGRSFEELRTLTLLAEIREPLPQAEGAGSAHAQQLSQLIDSAGDPRLRDFLAALAVSAVPEFPTFGEGALRALRDPAHAGLSSLELAFLDPVPGHKNVYRCFSRQLARSLRQRLSGSQPEHYRALNARAALHVQAEAEAAPGGDLAARHLHHLFEARDWGALERWLRVWSIPQSLLRRLWQAAQDELPQWGTLEGIALQVAAHYVRLGSYSHPDAERAFALLARSENPRTRAWTRLKRAEGAVLRGQVEEAARLLGGWQAQPDPSLQAEHALIEASIARWRSELERAALLIEEGARAQLAAVPEDDSEGRLIHAKVAVWAGLIHKDQGQLELAQQDFASVRSGDELIEARTAFQLGDVQLMLGRFDAALASLSSAVRHAYRSEAPVQEQARYLSRRGSLYRLRFELAEAEADFAAAGTLLRAEGANDRAERAFWFAKVEDERALYLLALARHGEAIRNLTDNASVFQSYQAATGVDAHYRLLRSRLKLALAYGLRAQASAYGPPLALPWDGGAHPDALHAERLAQAALAEIATQAARQRAYQSLWRDALHVASYLSRDPARAVDLAAHALELSDFAHQQALSACYAASARLRAEQPEVALELSQQAARALQSLRSQGEAGDRAALAWQRSLSLQALAQQGDLAAACRALGEVLSERDLAPYLPRVLRSAGEMLEASHGAAVRTAPPLKRLFGSALNEPDLRLPDLLVRAAAHPSPVPAVAEAGR